MLLLGRLRKTCLPLPVKAPCTGTKDCPPHGHIKSVRAEKSTATLTLLIVILISIACMGEPAAPAAATATGEPAQGYS